MKKIPAGACAWLLPLIASACPICDTDTGRQVRAGIFDENFWITLAMVLAPFPVLLLVLLAMHLGWSRFAAHHPFKPRQNNITNQHANP
jgi:hypothetical protein